MSPAITTTAETLSMFRSRLPQRSAVHRVTAISGYLLLVAAANVASVHWSPLTIGGLVIPAGTLFAGLSLTARDLVDDVLGTLSVTAGILAGTAISAVLASPHFAVASVVAFAVSETLDALVYARLRHRTRLAAIGTSNAIGLLVDSTLFVPLAFGTMTAVPGQILGKTIATVLTLAALHLVGTARQAVLP